MTTVEKMYKDADGEWQTTSSLSEWDLPVVRILLGRAEGFILDQRVRKTENDPSGESRDADQEEDSE